MSETCIQPAISWLDLERYALEDMTGEERTLVAEHLDACEACLSCLTHLQSREPIAMPALTTLPESPTFRFVTCSKESPLRRKTKAPLPQVEAASH